MRSPARQHVQEELPLVGVSLRDQEVTFLVQTIPL